MSDLRNCIGTHTIPLHFVLMLLIRSAASKYGMAIADLIRHSRTLSSLTIGQLLPRQRELANTALLAIFGALRENRTLRRFRFVLLIIRQLSHICTM